MWYTAMETWNQNRNMNAKSILDPFRNVLAIASLAFFVFDAMLLGTMFEAFTVPHGATDDFIKGLLAPENSVMLVSLLVGQTFAYAVISWFVLISPIRKLRIQVAYFIAGVKSGRLNPPTLYPDLAYIISFFNRSFEILWNFKEEFKAGRVLRSEVELASEIQRNVLKKTDVRIGSLDIVGNTKPATEVGGDSYDIIPRGSNCYVYLGDVTGHGVAS